MKFTFFVSGSIRSNFSHRALMLAEQLSDFGHDVTIIAPMADKYNNFIPEKIQKINNIKIVQPFQFDTKRLEINLMPYIFCTIFNIIQHTTEVVYIYKPTPISVIGLFAKFIWKSTVVLDMDDLGSEVMKIEGHPWYQRKLVEWSEKIAARYADRIVVASTFLLEMYRERYPNKDMLLIPNGVGASWFHPIIKSDGEKHLVFLGSLNRINILEPLFDVLPKIFSLFPDLKVTIIGDGAYLQYFKEWCRSKNILGRIDFTGWLSLELAKKYLRAGNLGYCYIPNELTNRAASNMKVSQYLARGVLPIVSDVGDLPRSVDNGNVGYIATAGDIISLCESIIDALNDKDRWNKSQSAQQFAKENFEWERLARLFERWVVRPQEKISQRKVIIVATELPSLGGGARIRNFYLAKKLSEQGFFVEILCLSNDLEKEQIDVLSKIEGISLRILPDKKLYPWGNVMALVFRVIPYMYQYRRSGLMKELKRSIDREAPAIVQLEQVNAYYAVAPILKNLHNKGIKIVLDAHNIEHVLFEKTIPTFSFLKRIIGWYILPHFKKIEKRAVSFSDVVLACSQDDADFLRRFGAKQVFVVENGVDVERFKSVSLSSREKHSILFMGGMTYSPNNDALSWYFSEVHDRIKKRFPDMKFYAIGSRPEKWLIERSKNDSSIVLPGFVPDERAYLEKATVCISPMRIGSGTGLKILTYMAAGKAVVSTSVGARGIEYSDGDDIMIAETSQDFFLRMVEIMESPSLAEKIGIQARETMSKKYTWEHIVEKLNLLYRSI